jgi:hypothetical protein
MPFIRRERRWDSGAGEGIMQIDTWYDLAVRELSELADHAKELISEAEKNAKTVRTPTASESEPPAEPPAQAA